MGDLFRDTMTLFSLERGLVPALEGAPWGRDVLRLVMDDGGAPGGGDPSEGGGEGELQEQVEEPVPAPGHGSEFNTCSGPPSWKKPMVVGSVILAVVLIGIGYWVGGSASANSGFVSIPAGSFTMGSPAGEIGRNEGEDQRQVTITRPFEMQVTPVTQGQWQELMGYSPSHFGNCGVDCPVENVNWHEALAYANALSGAKGLDQCFACTGSGPDVNCDLNSKYAKPQDCPGYRLPTEAEWEYAARAGSAGGFHTGDITDVLSCPNMDGAGWYGENSGRTTHKVGEKAPNKWGLYDMNGNVWERTWDWYQGHSGSDTLVDPYGPSQGMGRVLKGGSWSFPAKYSRSAVRVPGPPWHRCLNVGFRLVRTL